MDNVDEDERALVSSVPRGIQNVRYSSFTESHNIGDVSDGFSSRPILQQDGQSARGRFHKFGMPSSSQRSFESGSVPLQVSPDTFLALPMDTSTLAHGSLVAILSLWGNMLGAGMLVLPWAMAKAGFGAGIALVLVTSLALLYTCRLVVQRMHDAGVGGAAADFSAVCSCYLGKWGERVCNVGMCLSDFCILTIHWMLLSNFSFYSVALAADPARMSNETVHDFRPSPDMVITCVNRSDVCPPFAGEVLMNETFANTTLFRNVWSLERTVPGFLALLIFPLLHFKQPSFFSKFNTLSFMSALQIVVFLFIMAVSLGSAECAANTASDTGGGWRFPAVVGVIVFSMRAHHVVIPVLRNQRRPMSNMRDVNIAFACTALTYLLIGILFAVFFPNAPFCTQQVFLDNFSFDNLAVFNIRVMLAIQFIASFPLRAYLLRVRTLQNVLGFTHISQPAIFIFNCITTLAWILISQHAARPADFIRYVGATTGLVTQIILPLACQLMFLRQNLLLSYRTMAGYGLLVLAGVAVLAGQFTGV